MHNLSRLFLTRFSAVVILGFILSCGSNPKVQPPGGSTTTTTNQTTIPNTNPTYSVGGTVTGLKGTSLVLQNNGGDDLVVTANGSFTFPTKLAKSAAYSITVLKQPQNQDCVATNQSGNGVVGTVNVMSVTVACISDSWLTQLGDIVKPVGGNTSGEEFRVVGTVLDSAGNVYFAGDTDSNLAEPNGGIGDIFFGKFNGNGDLLWVTQFGAVTVPAGGSTAGHDFIEAITIDDKGNLYAAGGSDGSLGESNGGRFDAILMKLNAKGELQWLKQLGSGAEGAKAPGGDVSENDFCAGVAVDSSGDVICAGTTYGSLGEKEGGGNKGDGFVWKTNNDGDFQWIKQFGGGAEGAKMPGGDTSNSDFLKGVTVDRAGNIYCSGETDGSLGEPHGGSLDMFAIKLDRKGELQWVNQLGGTGFLPNGGNTRFKDSADEIAIDVSGALYIAGSTNGALGEANGGLADAVLWKLDNDGNTTSIIQIGAETEAKSSSVLSAARFDILVGVAVDAFGNVYCSGFTLGNLGEIKGGSASVFADVFVMKLNAKGDLEWLRQLGSVTPLPGGSSAGHDVVLSNLAVDSSGSPYVIGTTNSTLGDANAGGDYDIFGLKLTPDGELNF